jgi:hypothetical protein
MAGTTIKIEGKTYPIKFGYGAFRIMGKKWGCKGINETMQKLSVLDGMGAELTFDQEDVISDMILAGIEFANPEAEVPHQNKVMDALLKDMSVLTNVTNDLVNSLPQQSGNVQPVKSTGKGKPKQKK